jgi:uncharacterized protein DUF1883
MALRIVSSPPGHRYHIGPRDSLTFEDRLTPRQMVSVRLSSTDPLDVYFLDERNFGRFENGEEFEYFGKLGVQSLNRFFIPTRTAAWYLVLDNPSEDIVTVNLDAKVRAR